MKKNYVISALMLLFGFPLTVSAQDGCNIFRVKDKVNDVSVASNTSLCQPVSNVGEVLPPEDPVEKVTEEDEAAWVQFINDACYHIDLSTLAEVEQQNANYVCDDINYVSLPSPAVTSFQSGISFARSDLASLSGMELVTSVPSLNISYTDVRTTAALSALTSLNYLDASFSALETTEGLEGLTVVKNLIFYGSQLRDTSGLRNIQFADDLNFVSSQLSSVSGLSSLETVRDLSINNTSITSLTGLEALREARTINLTGLPIINFTGLGGMERVTGSFIARDTSLQTLDGLEGLAEVGYMHFRNSAGLNDVRGLRNLTKSTRIDFDGMYNLYDTNVTNDPASKMDEDSLFCENWRNGNITVSGNTRYSSLCEDPAPESEWVNFVNYDCFYRDPIDGISSLLSLGASCSNLSLTDMPTANEFTAISKLDFYGNGISQITGLDDLIAVSGEINFDYNNLANLNGLGSLISADRLMVRGNDLISFQGLSSLSTINVINAEFNTISDLRGIEGIAHFDELILFANNLGALYGLESLTSVGRLVISRNPLYTLRGLDNLRSANEINIALIEGDITLKLPDDSPFCVAYRAGDLGNVVVPTGYTVDNFCDPALTTSAQGNREIGAWVTNQEFTAVGSWIGAMEVEPSGTCEVGQSYYKRPQAYDVKPNWDGICELNYPWGVDVNQPYTGESSSTNGSGGPGAEYQPTCFAVQQFDCTSMNNEGFWQLESYQDFVQWNAANTVMKINDRPTGVCEVGQTIQRVLKNNDVCTSVASGGGTIDLYCRLETYRCVN